MKTTSINFQRIAAIMIIIALLLFLLLSAQTLIKPIVFALILSIMLRPLCNWYDRWVPWGWLSILLTFLTSLLPFLGLSYIFFVQLRDVVADLPSITTNLEKGIDALINLVQNNLPISIENEESWFRGAATGLLDTLRTGLTASSAVLAGFFITLLYVFFLLLYRKSIKAFLISQFKASTQHSAKTILRKIQKMNERYLYGMLIVILILSTLNSLGLYLIGIRYALFWGFLGGVLAIIPYLGTSLGGLLPFLYAMATTDNYWQPLSVVIFYFLVQQLEGNVITPKIVGSSVKLNPLAAIFALIVGAYTWGIAGVILAIPLLAIVRIIFSHIDVLKPYALLLSSDLSGKSHLFEDKFDADQYRLLSFLRSRPSTKKKSQPNKSP